MPQIGGLSYRHVDLEGGYPGLYRSDGVHLSEVGMDIFNFGFTTAFFMSFQWSSIPSLRSFPHS